MIFEGPLQHKPLCDFYEDSTQSQLKVFKHLHSFHSYHVNDMTKAMNSGITVYFYICADSKTK